jgi:chromosome segregation ATPase
MLTVHHVECVYVQARITALEREIERLNIEKQNLQTDAKSQMLLNEEWQQKLKVSEERSSASMRELQDNCKVLENTNENLKAELAEAYKAFDEAWEEEDIGKKKSEKPGWTMPSVFSLFSGGSKKHERSVNDCVKSAIKDKTQKFKDELARVNAELTVSKKNVDEVKKEKQKLYDAWDTATKEMNAKLVDVNSQHANEVMRLKADLATTAAHLADLQNTCKAKESELEETRAKLTATAEHKEIVKEESTEAHQARGAEKNVVTAVPKGAEDDLQHANAQSLDAELATTKAQLAAQEYELRELRELMELRSLAQEKLLEAYARRLQEDQQWLASWNTVPM